MAELVHRLRTATPFHPDGFGQVERESQPGISIICPVHDEEANLVKLYDRVSRVMDQLHVRWELILVDDGSQDGSAEQIAKLHYLDGRVKGIRFSRNFGFQIAVTAGLNAASGDAVILMDADLQDPPEVIPDLIARWRDGFDVVYSVRSERDGETWFKKATAVAFYRLIHRITSVNIPMDTGDFRLMDRRVVDSIIRMPERSRFLRGMVSWAGFRQTGLPYHRQPRFAGKSKFTLGKMIRFAWDAITSFSNVPLQIASWVGFALAGLSGIGMVLGIGLRLAGANPPLAGQAATLVAVLFLGAVQLICLGIIGEYLGRMYDEVKGRPLYLVEQTWGLEQGSAVHLPIH